MATTTIELVNTSTASGSGTILTHVLHPPQPPAPTLSSSQGTAEAKTESSKDGTTTSVSPAEPSAQKFRAQLQFATMCWSLFLAGWNDGTTGPLLPRIQSVYHVGFFVVSVIFICNCVGFVLAAAANVALTDRFGFGTVMVIGSMAQVVGYSLAAPALPFPVFCIAYAINGFGLSLQDAGANGYVACIKDGAATKMGILHAVYGLGALSAPLVATQFAQLPHWSFHYLVSLGIALSNTLLLIGVIRFRTQEQCLAAIGQAPSETGNSTDNKYKQIFRMRPLHLLAVFTFIYVGTEVTIGGSLVCDYVINLRGGGASAGYIPQASSAVRLTLGRVGLLWLNKLVGERRAVFLYVLLAIALELVVWLVPSLIGGAIAVSLVGMLLGPVYPIIMNHSSRVLPPWLLTGCIGWIAGFGQAGSAFFPFLTGALASREGIKSLQPLLVSMMGVMFILWAVVPNSSRRVD
ncbi:MFS general substrate transporter [Amylocystis lapponica]|nr:MFS general substrate transporter [Amylocystis lapponica]